MFGIKISPKTFFENRRFIKEAKRQILKEQQCQKVVKHVAKDGTIALLGYKKDAIHFSNSLAKMPNGDVLGKIYYTGSYWLPFKTHIRNISSRLTKANNAKVPFVEKIYNSEQFGENAKPIITKTVSSDMGYMKSILNIDSGVKNVEHFFAETGHLIKRTFDAAGKLTSRTDEIITK